MLTNNQILKRNEDKKMPEYTNEDVVTLTKEIESKQRQAHEAITELRADIKDIKGKEVSADQKEKQEKINKFLDSYDELEQKAISLKAAKEQEDKAIQERIETLEGNIARQSKSGVDFREGDAYKQTKELLINGTRPEQKVLRTDVDSAGGFLVQEELESFITKKITEISPMRPFARVRTIGTKTLLMPVRDTIPVATYEGEAVAGSESESSYTSETVTTNRQTVTVPSTMDQLQDSAFNMESEIFSDAREGMGLGEANGFFTGTGVDQPFGVLTDTRITGGALTSSASGVVSGVDVILLSGELKIGYNPRYMFTRGTLASLRAETGSDGQFIWQPGLSGGAMSSINGFEYIIAQAMPEIAASSFSVAFGDWASGYTIVDRTGISVIRDEYTSKKQAIVEFTFHRWNTGKVTLPEAIKVLQTAP